MRTIKAGGLNGLRSENMKNLRQTTKFTNTRSYIPIMYKTYKYKY